MRFLPLFEVGYTFLGEGTPFIVFLLTSFAKILEGGHTFMRPRFSKLTMLRLHLNTSANIVK